MTQTDTTAIQHEVVVPVSIEKAFALFTGLFDDIKPREHNMLAVPIAETVFETHVGGHIYDRGIDGSECRWARVLVWEPPTRISFSWDIGPTWQVETDNANTSEVDIRFTSEAPDRTRVLLEHRHLDRHGDGWLSVREGVDNEGGWPLYLARYAAVAEQRS